MEGEDKAMPENAAAQEQQQKAAGGDAEMKEEGAAGGQPAEEEKVAEVEEEPKPELKMMQKAFDLKDEGSYYFKQKDYAKAISKYCRVQLFIKPLAPPDVEATETDPSLSMVQNMKQYSLTPDELKSCRELQATAFLNIAICYHLMKEYQKAIDNCQKSLAYNKTIKCYYRMGQAYKGLLNYEAAIKAFKAAIMLDVSDPNDIQTEMMMCERLERAKEKKRLQEVSKKMQGLFGGDDEKPKEQEDQIKS